MSLTYWISFKIRDDADYQTRYDALVDEIDQLSTKTWSDTTSFYLIETGKEIDALATALKACIDLGKDMLVIRRLDNKSARFMGKLPKPTTLKGFMSYATRTK
jgi:hypothetical protein